MKNSEHPHNGGTGMSSQLSSVLDIHNCSVYRGDTRVFEDLSLRIDSGENTAILGPNGAGKTTLLKLITQEIRPVVREGSSIELFGKKRWNVWQLRDRLGIISDDLQQKYLPGASGLNVILSGYYSSIDVAPHQQFTRAQVDRAEAIMKQIGISHLRESNYGTMSTGEKRRCLLGRALLHDPEALILDEPTSGLDLQASHIYFQHMINLIEAGKTLILVTHHIHEILPHISRVVMLKNGEIYQDGPKESLLSSKLLSELYDTPVKVIGSNGYYQVVPD